MWGAVTWVVEVCRSHYRNSIPQCGVLWLWCGLSKCVGVITETDLCFIHLSDDDLRFILALHTSTIPVHTFILGSSHTGDTETAGTRTNKQTQSQVLYECGWSRVLKTGTVNCNCNRSTCIAPPTRRPRVHHRVKPPRSWSGRTAARKSVKSNTEICAPLCTKEQSNTLFSWRLRRHSLGIWEQFPCAKSTHNTHQLTKLSPLGFLQLLLCRHWAD